MENWARAITFIDNKDKSTAAKLEEVLSTNKQEVPFELIKMSEQHEDGGGNEEFYIRPSNSFSCWRLECPEHYILAQRRKPRSVSKRWRLQESLYEEKGGGESGRGG